MFVVVVCSTNESDEQRLELAADVEVRLPKTPPTVPAVAPEELVCVPELLEGMLVEPADTGALTDVPRDEASVDEGVFALVDEEDATGEVATHEQALEI